MYIQIQEEFDTCYKSVVQGTGSEEQDRNMLLMLQEAALAAEAIGDGARKDLLDWFCHLQLNEYRVTFADGVEVSTLDNIKRR